MVRPPARLPAELGEVFTYSEALAAGVNRGRLQRADIERVAQGLYRLKRSAAEESAPRADEHPAQSWRRRQLERAGMVWRLLPDDVFFCGYTAAVIWGLPVPPSGSDDLEIAVLTPCRPPIRSGMRSSTFSRHLVSSTLHDGFRVIAPASLWCTLGPRLTHDALVALGDALIREARVPGTHRLEAPPLTTRARLEATVRTGRRPGLVRLREALPLLSTQSASPPETHLRLRCREWGLPVPALDFDVRNAHGRLLGASELAFPEFRVALEYEGDHHRTSVRQWNRDIEKQQAYAAAGWTMIRVTARMLYREPNRLRAVLLQAFRDRGWDGDSETVFGSGICTL